MSIHFKDGEVEWTKLKATNFQERIQTINATKFIENNLSTKTNIRTKERFC